MIEFYYLVYLFIILQNVFHCVSLIFIINELVLREMIDSSVRFLFLASENICPSPGFVKLTARNTSTRNIVRNERKGRSSISAPNKFPSLIILCWSEEVLGLSGKLCPSILVLDIASVYRVKQNCNSPNGNYFCPLLTRFSVFVKICLISVVVEMFIVIRLVF